MKIEIQKRIGENLRLVRTARNLSQEEIANFLGMTRSMYTHYELGNRAQDAETLFTLSAFYSLEMSAFFEPDRNRLINIIVNSVDLDAETRELVNLYNQLPPYSQGKLLERAYVLAEQEEIKREKMHAMQAAPFK